MHFRRHRPRHGARRPVLGPVSARPAGLFVEIVDDRQAVPDDDIVAVPQDRHLAARWSEFVALTPVAPILVIERDGDLFEGKAAVAGGEPAAQAPRSEERRVGKEWVSTCRSWWSA